MPMSSGKCPGSPFGRWDVGSLVDFWTEGSFGGGPLVSGLGRSSSCGGEAALAKENCGETLRAGPGGSGDLGGWGRTLLSRMTISARFGEGARAVPVVIGVAGAGCV